MNRKSTAYFSVKLGVFRLELGGIMAGTTHLGKRFVSARQRSDSDGYLGSEWDILEDEIELLDTLGGRMKVSLQGGGWHWYAQGGYQGLVADGGEDRTVTFTGWKLKQAGRGNHWGAVTGLAYNFGKFQIAPAFLYQRPLEGPLPLLGDFYAADTNIYYPGVRPRNVLDDPFAVLGNREQTAFELMFSPSGRPTG